MNSKWNPVTGQPLFKILKEGAGIYIFSIICIILYIWSYYDDIRLKKYWDERAAAYAEFYEAQERSWNTQQLAHEQSRRMDQERIDYRIAQEKKEREREEYDKAYQARYETWLRSRK